VRAAVAEPERLRLHAQPIVELTSGSVAGYEMLSRFTGPWQAPPDVWFAAAEQWGFNATPQARVLRMGIASRELLPPDTFLTVNVDPHLLGDDDVSAALTSPTPISPGWSSSSPSTPDQRPKPTPSRSWRTSGNPAECWRWTMSAPDTPA